MRRFIRMLAFALVLGQSGCAQDPPTTAPEDFPLEVEFVPIATTFSNEEDVAAVLTNRSRGRIYVTRDCPTQLERREEGAWVVADLTWEIFCTDDVPLPYPISPGGNIQLVVYRTDLNQPILPGVYRFPIKIGKTAETLEWHWSAEFAVTESR